LTEEEDFAYPEAHLSHFLKTRREFTQPVEVERLRGYPGTILIY